MLTKETKDTPVLREDGGRSYVSRRRFFGYLGASSALIATASSCSKGHDHIPASFFGSGDVGILNYAYLLEQLEAAFYIKVMDEPYGKMTYYENTYLTDIRDHEVAHREFFKAAIGSSAIPSLTFNFSSIDFRSRESVLGAAKSFEDLGVSAYNGAGPYISSPDYLTLAGKIVSVEARHAALIRELLEQNSFADSTVVDNMGLDESNDARYVLLKAAPYLLTKIDLSHLPF